MVNLAFRNVLVLAAHPDDEIACSGTINRLVLQNADVRLVTFSMCEDVGDFTHELACAKKRLGIASSRVEFLPNKRLPEFSAHMRDVLDEERTERPDLVLTPARSDVHQDHAAVTAEAIRVFKWSTMLGYEHPQNTVGSSLVNAYIALDDWDVIVKVDHAKAYKSQSHKPYMQDAYIRGMVAVRGMQIGQAYAEAFEVIRLVL